MTNFSSIPIHIRLRFYGNLNHLIDPHRRGYTFTRRLPETTSVKDLIEGCGVPHTETDLILVDSRPVGFDKIVTGGERVSVFPFFHFIDLPSKYRLQYPEPKFYRFLADVNLGKLARFLRMAGFDTAYYNDVKDPQLISQMQEENRILLTRDRKLLMHRVVCHGYLVRSAHIADQLEEILERYNLFDKVNPFSRCIHCNTLLESVSKEEVLAELEPLTRKYFNRFSRCSDCEQIYWAGSHRERLHPKVKSLLKISSRQNMK